MNYLKNLFLIFCTVFSFSSFAVPPIDSSELSFDINKVSGINYKQEDRFHIIVSSIATSDKDLFPGIGQMILHSKGEDQNLELKGAIIVTPESRTNYIYINIAKINKGEELDVIHASKFGFSLAVLKMQLSSSLKKISAKSGGLLQIKILKNGLFKTFRDYPLKIEKEQGEWIGKVKSKEGFLSFRTMFLKASAFGV